ncbi:MAG: type III pantothenate kinase [Rikenellaceae bacterium]
MVNILIDIGNSRVKYAVMEGDGSIMEMLSEDNFSQERVRDFARRYDISGAIVCSTRGDATAIIAELKEIVKDALLFDTTLELPIECNYSTPETLGRDRLALAIGAHDTYKNRDILLIDCGTAITIDFVSAEGAFEGGVISPGVNMRFKALHEFTASLPLCQAQEEDFDIAQTTQSAIKKGVMNGICYEMEGYISHFRSKFEKLLVIFVGGDAKYFDKRIKNTIFAEQELLFKGLNKILEYNANKK